MKIYIIKNSFLLIVFLTLIACDGSGSPTKLAAVKPTPPIAPVLKSFSLLIERNPELETDLEFDVEGNIFKANVPEHVPVKSLKPTFTFTGKEVKVNDISQVSGETSQDFTKVLIYTVSNQSEDIATYSVVLNRVVAPTLQSFSFLIEHNPQLEADLEFVLEDGTFSALVPSDISVKSLTPTFNFTGNQVSTGDVAQISGETSQDFTQVLTYTVSNGAGTAASYAVDLTRFTGLPIIYLTTEQAITSKEEYVNGTFSLDGWRHYDPIDELEMEIRGRGNSTWSKYPKKPFQLKLESKRSLFGMQEDKKWLFLAEYSDKTLLRNHLAYELGHRTSLRWTPSGHFAEVFVNGEHEGVYHITEKVEDGDNRVAIGDTGFLLEIDQPHRLDADDVFFRTGSYLVNIKKPSLSYNDPKYSQVKLHVNKFETVLFSDNFMDPVTGYTAYADVDSFVDWFLVNEIAKNVDAKYFSSIFFHWIPGEKIRMGPIWDFDLGFGNVNYSDAAYSEGWRVRWNVWIDRMLDDPAFVSKVKQRFADINAQRADIKGSITQWAEQLNLAQAENDSIWQTLGKYVWPNPVFYDTYEEEVAHLIDWLDSRMDWMADAIENL